jgi:Domain of unknown function (DUF4340)
MQLRKTFIALVVLAIVGGFAYYINRHPEAQQKHKLFKLAPADIAKIELRGPGRDLVMVRSGDKAWRIVKPVATAADNNAVDAMAQAIANLEVLETVAPDAGDLGNFGLANPAVTIIVTTKDKRELPGIMIGSNTPVGSNTYIKTTDKPAVLLISSGFTAQSGRTLKDLRSHVLVNLTADQMKRVSITHPDGATIELVRDDDTWKITKPREYPADETVVKSLLNVIAHAHVNEFIEDNPTDLEKFGLANPSLEFEIDGGKDNAKYSVGIGFEEPEASKKAVFARTNQDDRPVCTIGDYIVKAVDKSFDQLRDKTVLRFDQSKVARITMFGGPISIVLQRTPDNKWNVIAQGKTVPATPEVVVSLIGQLHDLQGSTIVEDPMTDPQRFGMVHPTLTTVLYDRDSKEIGSLKVSQIEAIMNPNGPAPKAAKKTIGYATSSAGTAVYEVAPGQVVDLENTASTLKDEAAPKPAQSAKSATPASAEAPGGAAPAAATP